MRGVIAVLGIPLILIGGAIWAVSTTGLLDLSGDPSPRGEVTKYLASAGLTDTATVGNCEWSDPRPEDSYPFDRYRCDLTSSRQVVLDRRRHIPAGTSSYCFSVPRATRYDADVDLDAIPLGRSKAFDCLQL
jgi:hypothetical protein